MTQFTTFQVIKSIGSAFINEVDIETMVRLEARLYKYIEDANLKVLGINPSDSSVWPKAFKDRLDLLRQSSRFSGKIKNIENGAFGYSIWDAGSSASMAVVDDKLKPKDFEIAVIDTKIKEAMGMFQVLDISRD